METNDLIWLAGYLEGEGSFGCYSSGGVEHPNSIVIQVTSTDLDVVSRVAQLFGNKKVMTAKKALKQQYGVRLYGQPAVELMMLLYSLMGERRKSQIKEAILKYGSRNWGEADKENPEGLKKWKSS